MPAPRIYHEASITSHHAPHNFYGQIPTLLQAPAIMQQPIEMQRMSMDRAARRVSSCLSVKTSVTRVSGMKALLPLTLSTTSVDTQVYRPQQAEEFESPVAAINRFTFGGHDESPKKQKSPRSKKLSRRGGHFPRLPLFIRPERRDIPVYTEHGSPIPSPAYFTSEFSSSHNLSPSHSSSDEDWAAACSSPNTETSHHNDIIYTTDAIKISPNQSFGSSTTGKNSTSYDSSEMSFQCLGEHDDVKEPDGLKSPYVEMAHLDSMCLPDVLAQSMPPAGIVEGWLGSAHSTDDDYGSISGAIPPPVSMRSMGRSFNSAFEMHPGSSSITGARPTIIWNSRSRQPTTGMAAYNSSPLTAYDSHAASPIFDTESITSSATSHDEPPTPPPKERDYSPRMHSSYGLISGTNHRYTTQINNPTLDIVREKKAILDGCSLSIIEELIRYFPFSTFIDYRHHIYTVRTQISDYASQTQSQSSTDVFSLPSFHQAPLTPAPLTPSKSPSPRRMTLSLSSLTRTRTTFTARSRTPSPSPVRDKAGNRTTFGRAPALPLHAPLPRERERESSEAERRVSTHLDLKPLHRIFPNATGGMIQALYAYLLAYILLKHIRPPPTTSTSNPSSQNHPEDYTHSHITTTQSKRGNSLATTSHRRIPSKAADRLGIPFPVLSPSPHTFPSHSSSNIDDEQVSDLIQDFVLAQRIQDVRGCLERSVFCLCRGGVGNGDGEGGFGVGSGFGFGFGGVSGIGGEEEGPKQFLEGVMGRCLVEVVRGCEGVGVGREDAGGWEV